MSRGGCSRRNRAGIMLTLLFFPIFPQCRSSETETGAQDRKSDWAQADEV
eukprot:gene26775-biopygen17332